MNREIVGNKWPGSVEPNTFILMGNVPAVNDITVLHFVFLTRLCTSRNTWPHVLMFLQLFFLIKSNRGNVRSVQNEGDHLARLDVVVR